MHRVGFISSTTSRGYGADHQRLRAALLPEAYGKLCYRCGKTMERGQRLDLGHDDADRRRYRGIEHAACNRAAGARRGNRQRAKRTQQRKHRGHVELDPREV